MLVTTETFDDARAPLRFDYVVVGAGSAGCALAASLSEDAGCSVLLIEAGRYFGRIDQHPEVLQRIDKYSFTLAPGQSYPARPRYRSFVWAFEGQLNEHLTATIVRGKVVGGSSAVNGSAFTRGRPADYDLWAKAGASEWSFEKVLPSLRAIETDLDFGDSPLHGARGPVRVQRPRREHLGLASELFAQAALDSGFAWDPDVNGTPNGGVGMMPLNAVGVIRQNAGAAFIDRVMARRNLSLLDRANVQRIVFETDRAVGVEVARRNRKFRVDAGEVILCAGGINSPHLLMVSGVGPENKLRAVGIKPRHVLPVGSSFADHPFVVWPYTLSQGAMAAQGKQGGGVVLHYASAGDEAEDLTMVPYALRPPAEAGGGPVELGLHCGLGVPESRGEILLRSSSARRAPMVRYNYLSEPSDQRRLRECVQRALDFLARPDYRKGGVAMEADAAEAARSPQALDHWIATHLRTAYHSAGACRMGPETDETAVVDQYCRVHGLRGLRVADTSIIPFLMNRGAHATAILIGEHAACLIRVRSDHPSRAQGRQHRVG